ncbi:MAG: flagellar biosynthesis protein FlhF [Spirochaetaceae bacterium]|nr:flagellar biosynthesis protein FlhF [Spirochaetaceae bacterium]
MDECRKKVRDVYGERAQIMKQSCVKLGGIWGIGAHDGVEVTGYVPSQFAFIKKAPDPEEEKQKILTEAAKRTQNDPKMQEILNELKSLHEKIDTNTKNTPEFEHPNLENLSELMEKNDFTRAYRRQIIERVKKELPIEVIGEWTELEQRALVFIGETISVYKNNIPVKFPRIIIVIGPTGVGKTTTIAKLAVSYIMGMEDGIDRRVSLITIDRYRLAAARQLEEYAQVLQTPFAAPIDADELKRELALQRETADIILVDTIGRSPRDSVEIAEMKKMLEMCGRDVEIHLAVTAATKAADICDITAQFEPFGYKSIIVTKLDETNRVGNVISALVERGKSVSYITNGQESTHQTIKKANIIRFLINLEGFDVDRNRLEQHFNENQGSF